MNVEETYDFQMFKNICIDFESTHISIAEMKQFRALQRIVEINFNESIFNSDDIIFDIEITRRNGVGWCGFSI